MYSAYRTIPDTQLKPIRAKNFKNMPKKAEN